MMMVRMKRKLFSPVVWEDPAERHQEAWPTWLVNRKRKAFLHDTYDRHGRSLSFTTVALDLRGLPGSVAHDEQANCKF